MSGLPLLKDNRLSGSVDVSLIAAQKSTLLVLCLGITKDNNTVTNETPTAGHADNSL